MRLERRWSRLAAALLALAVAFALVPVFAYHLAGARGWDWLFLGLLGALVCLAAAMWLRLRKLRCPCCGESSARPRWRPGSREYCPRCGAPFRYDDEPEDPEEDGL